MDRLGYYKTLGVSPSATPQEIRSAYRALALKHHPDGSGCKARLDGSKTDQEREALKKEMNKTFSDLSAAHEVLSDKEKRMRYDRGEIEGEGVFAEGIFDAFFGGRSAPQKAQAMVLNLTISLLDVLRGKSVEKTVTRKITCQGCSGKGSLSHKKCGKCRGKGAYIEVITTGNMRFQQNVRCGHCEGTGEKNSGPPCETCKGRKMLIEDRKLKIDIPKGVMSGQNLVMQGMGNEMPGASTGDIVVAVSVEKDKVFSRISKQHLYMEKQVPISQLLSSSTLSITTLEGAELLLQVPDLSKVDIGEKFLRVPGEGLTSLGSKKRGDLFIRLVAVFTPRSELPSLIAELSAAEKAGKEARSSGVRPIPVQFFDQKALHETCEREGQEHEQEHYEGGQQQRCTTM